jgi:hypothetical protein
MDRLPTEIVQKIVGQLHYNQISRLRLVSRFLNRCIIHHPHWRYIRLASLKRKDTMQFAKCLPINNDELRREFNLALRYDDPDLPPFGHPYEPMNGCLKEPEFEGDTMTVYRTDLIRIMRLAPILGWRQVTL